MMSERVSERKSEFHMEPFAVQNSQPDVLFCARCTAIVVIAKTMTAARAQYPLSIFYFSLMHTLVHLPFISRFIEVFIPFRHGWYSFVSTSFIIIIMIVSPGPRLIIYVFRLPRCVRAIVLVLLLLLPNATKIGIVCIRNTKAWIEFHTAFRCSIYAHTPSHSWFVPMAFCSRQPADIINDKGEMDF